MLLDNNGLKMALLLLARIMVGRVARTRFNGDVEVLVRRTLIVNS